jgi:hypothetical protein
MEFTNCIFWNNNDIADDDGLVSVTNSIVDEVAYNGTNSNVNADPLFVDTANGIFNLKCNSAAINHGTLTGAPTTDFTDFARSGNPDAGAYEFGYALVDQPVESGNNPNLSGVPFLTAKSKIENTNNAIYKGINYVEMLPGFEVAPQTGAPTVFRAEIGGGCLSLILRKRKPNVEAFFIISCQVSQGY